MHHDQRRDNAPLDLAHLAELADRLRRTQAALEVEVAPSRQRFEALGPAGLFALAATEQRLADAESDRQRRRVHLVAANAAQRLGEQLAGQRADA